MKYWWDIQLSRKAYDVARCLTPQHLNILWAKLDGLFPDGITGEEVSKILSDRKKIADLLSYPSWEHVLIDVNHRNRAEKYLIEPQEEEDMPKKFAIEERTADFIASISLDEVAWTHRTIATFDTQEQADKAFSEYLAHPYRIGDTRYVYALLSDAAIVSYIDRYEAEEEARYIQTLLADMPPKKIILKKLIHRHEAVFREIEAADSLEAVENILRRNGLSHIDGGHVCRYLSRHTVDEIMGKHLTGKIKQMENYTAKREKKRRYKKQD